jgi:SAM-dependent methyltransferase
MYELIKSIVRRIISKKFLFQNEEVIRKLMYPFYMGEKCMCNICHSKIRTFEKLKTGDLLCPICGSLPRTRRLNELLDETFLHDGFSVLDFSPSRPLYRKLKKNKNIRYYPTDFEDEFLADYHFDITDIDSENEKFDLIICYHILEHIIEDEKAMKELYRVLKPDGKVMIQTPFKEGTVYEDYTMNTPELKLKHFGQEDHVRIYSVSGLVERLQKVGFDTDVLSFAKNDFLGLSDKEIVIIGMKPQ